MAIQQERLGFLLGDVFRLMRRAFRQRMADGSLTLAQSRALIYVARHEGIRQVELADMLEVRPITLTRLVDQLAEDGLVERRPDPADRRAYRIFPTVAAAPHLAEIEKVGAAVRADALRGIDKQEAAAVMRTLQKMHDNLTAR